ncbi:MAG: hypothetical protein P4M07_24955 [Xanthobacteraceae bacterium]|nr:hypothetical protein [Xanthobacteraceae bacterium]
MSKTARIEHDYQSGKDRLKISIRGYALTKKKDRDAILKKVVDAVERSPARLIAKEKQHIKSGKPGKKLPGSRREARLYGEEDDR